MLLLYLTVSVSVKPSGSKDVGGTNAGVLTFPNLWLLRSCFELGKERRDFLVDG